MQPPANLSETAPAPVRHVASVALQALGLAAELLTDAAGTPGLDSGADGVRDAVAAVTRRIPRIEDSDEGVADVVFAAYEMLRLCDGLASRNRLASPAAIGCAHLAEASAQLALEALTGDRGWTGVQALSRRARQVGELQRMRRGLDQMVATLKVNGVEGTPAARSFHDEMRRLTDAVDPDTD